MITETIYILPLNSDNTFLEFYEKLKSYHAEKCYKESLEKIKNIDSNGVAYLINRLEIVETKFYHYLNRLLREEKDAIKNKTTIL